MSKMKLEFNLSVTVLREGNRFIAYSPALDLSTSGKTFTQARGRFFEAATLFFEEIHNKGITKEALTELGWSKQKSAWQPPMVVSQDLEKFRVPV